MTAKTSGEIEKEFIDNLEPQPRSERLAGGDPQPRHH